MCSVAAHQSIIVTALLQKKKRNSTVLWDDHDGTKVVFRASERELRDELAKREHIMNKSERRAQRRKRNEDRHGRSKDKNR